MPPPKLIDTKNAQMGAIPDVTIGIFVRSAGLANLLVATLVLIEFSAIALVNHDGKAFQLGLSLIPLVTVVIWATAAVLCVGALTPRWLLLLGRRLIRTSRFSPSDRSGVWDDWLDSYEPHHP
jgi:hypothetical protein